jgi:hypothetical protein
MGLDMYAFASKMDEEELHVHYQIPWEEREEMEDPKEEIAYWRKCRQIHNFMEDIYRSRGGQETFNCEIVKLTPEDLDDLEIKLKTGGLRDDGGFFFGDWDLEPEMIDYTHEFIQEARKRIAQGEYVYYDSWW